MQPNSIQLEILGLSESPRSLIDQTADNFSGHTDHIHRKREEFVARKSAMNVTEPNPAYSKAA
jgi:hypothetical protein